MNGMTVMRLSCYCLFSDKNLALWIGPELIGSAFC